VKDFVYITDDTYTKHEVLEMEKHILKKLKFELGCPISINFLRRFSKVAACDGATHMMAKYFIELIEIEYHMCHVPRSMAAAASLFVALCLATPVAESEMAGVTGQRVDVNDIWSSTLHYYTNYKLDDLQPVINQLIPVVLNAPKSKLSNVYTKYTSSKMDQVALKPVKCESLLQSLMTNAM